MNIIMFFVALLDYNGHFCSGIRSCELRILKSIEISDSVLFCLRKQHPNIVNVLTYTWLTEINTRAKVMSS